MRLFKHPLTGLKFRLRSKMIISSARYLSANYVPTFGAPDGNLPPILPSATFWSSLPTKIALPAPKQKDAPITLHTSVISFASWLR